MPVAIVNDRGRIRLRWQYDKKSKSMNLGLDHSPKNLVFAEMVAKQIERDLLIGKYDETLASYRPDASVKTSYNIGCVDLFDKYTKSRKLSKGAMCKHNAIRTKMTQFFGDDLVGKVDARLADKFKLFLLNGVSANTAKSYLWQVRKCWEWGKGKYSVNHDIWNIDDIRNSPVIKREPFTVEEAQSIMNTFKEHKHYSPYYHFVCMLFMTSCRPGELKILTWRDVPETLDRLLIWSHKTQRNKVIWLSEPAQSILKDLYPERDDGLIFKAPKGKQIRPDQLNKRGWRKVLQELELPHRPIYTCRHTAISQALSEGVSPIDVAEQAGIRLDTMVRHYASSMKKAPVFGTSYEG